MISVVSHMLSCHLVMFPVITIDIVVIVVVIVIVIVIEYFPGTEEEEEDLASISANSK